MSEKSLKEKTVSGFKWSTADRLFQQFFVLISGIALARMIDKENYGLIGVLAIFTGIANILQESGFTSAIIRKKNISQSDYITVFYTNIFIGVFLYLLLFFLSPYISQYYEKPVLIPLSRFIFLSFLFNSFSVVQNARLLKELNYKFLTKNNISAIFISYSTALVLAWLGYGVWALAFQMVTMSFVKTFNLWFFSKWKPRGSFSTATFREFFSFSFKLMCGSILNVTMANIPQNVISKQYSFGIVGLYNQAYRLYCTVMDFLAGTTLSISYPVLSAIDDDLRLKRVYRKFIRIKAFIVFPLFIGMILLARPFIHLLLGERWLDAYPVLQLLCIGGIFSALDSSNIDMLRLKGKSGTVLSLIIFQGVLMACVIAAFFIFQLNYLYLVAGMAVTNFLKYLITTIITNRHIEYKIKELFFDLLPYGAISLLAFVFVYCFFYLVPGLIVQLILGITFFSVIYLGVLYYLDSKIVKDFFGVLTKKRF